MADPVDGQSGSEDIGAHEGASAQLPWWLARPLERTKIHLLQS